MEGIALDLGLVHGAVGRLEQRLGLLAVFRIERDADARGDEIDVLAADLVGLAEGAE
ncbi:hypothetical protein D9M69_417160 [compost metagenome]